jgi:hypothetical protein
MKNILLLFALSLSLNSLSQDMEQQTLYKSKTGWEIIKTIRNSKDTSIYFYWSFRNAEYTAITDLGSIFYSSKEDVEAFAVKLKEFSEKPSGVTISSKVGRTTLQLYDFSNDIYIYDKDNKHFKYTKQNSGKVADEILLNSKFMDK